MIPILADVAVSPLEEISYMAFKLAPFLLGGAIVIGLLMFFIFKNKNSKQNDHKEENV